MANQPTSNASIDSIWLMICQPDAPAAAPDAAAEVCDAPVSEQAASLDCRCCHSRGDHGGGGRRRQLLWRWLSHLPAAVSRRRTIYG